MELHYCRADGEERKLGDFDTKEAAEEAIQAFLDERNYKPPYWRMWQQLDGTHVYDVGSHTEEFTLR